MRRGTPIDTAPADRRRPRDSEARFEIFIESDHRMFNARSRCCDRGVLTHEQCPHAPMSRMRATCGGVRVLCLFTVVSLLDGAISELGHARRCTLNIIRAHIPTVRTHAFFVSRDETPHRQCMWIQHCACKPILAITRFNRMRLDSTGRRRLIGRRSQRTRETRSCITDFRSRWAAGF